MCSRQIYTCSKCSIMTPAGLIWSSPPPTPVIMIYWSGAGVVWWDRILQIIDWPKEPLRSPMSCAVPPAIFLLLVPEFLISSQTNDSILCMSVCLRSCLPLALLSNLVVFFCRVCRLICQVVDLVCDFLYNNLYIIIPFVSQKHLRVAFS